MTRKSTYSRFTLLVVHGTSEPQRFEIFGVECRRCSVVSNICSLWGVLPHTLLYIVRCRVPNRAVRGSSRACELHRLTGSSDRAPARSVCHTVVEQAAPPIVLCHPRYCAYGHTPSLGDAARHVWLVSCVEPWW